MLQPMVTAERKLMIFMERKIVQFQAGRVIDAHE